MQKKLSKIFVLSDLLIQEIDSPVLVPTNQTKEIQDKARELQILLEPVIDKFYNNTEVSKSTLFLTLQNKFPLYLSLKIYFQSLHLFL